MAELGWPRKEHRCHDGEPVESLNWLTGRKRAQKEGVDVYPLSEGKPTLRDACGNIMILWVAAQMLGVALIVVLFDYKYFFHHLAWALCELWALGYVLPAQREGGGADSELIATLYEYVMAMGWTRASLNGQDLGNALLWKLLKLVDEATASYVTDMRHAHPDFDEWWKIREALPHDDYGSQARLHDALQYTDDMHAVAVGPVVGAHFVVCFARFVGPAYVPGSDPRALDQVDTTPKDCCLFCCHIVEKHKH